MCVYYILHLLECFSLYGFSNSFHIKLSLYYSLTGVCFENLQPSAALPSNLESAVVENHKGNFNLVSYD